MDGWKTSFLLGMPIFRGYVSFRECDCWFGLVVFRVSLSNHPFHFWGSNRNPNHRAPDHQLILSWQFLGAKKTVSRSTPWIREVSKFGGKEEEIVELSAISYIFTLG